MIRAVVVALALLLVAPAAALAEGELVQVSGAPKVYRIVGNAPLWIGTCAYTNGCQGLQQVANLDAYQRYPSDGALTSGGSDGGIYRWVGGAPLWISSCAYGPGCPNVIQIDDVSYNDREHVREYPADGTVVRNVGDGGVYRFAGGAPLLVRCDLGVGCSNPAQVDGGTFAALGSANARKNMRQYPAAGATVYNADTQVYHRFAGGSPLPLSNCDGCAATMVDNRTFQMAGTGTPDMPHLLAAPAEGTFLSTGANMYRVAGGAAVQLGDCGFLSGCPGAVGVDASTISSLGGGRLLALPKDGTVLRAVPSGRTWEVIGGKRRETFIPGLAGIEIDEFGVSTIPLDTPPPTPPAPAPEVFKPVISSGYKVYRRYTRFTSLKVRDALPGSIVTVNCSGKNKGCPFKKQKYYRLKGTSLNVARYFRKAKLRSGASVTVRVSSPTGARKQMVFKIRSRKLPIRTTRCSTRGAKLTRCAT